MGQRMSAGITIQSASIGGRIFSTLFFAAFAALGVFFCGLVGREGYQIARTYTWQKTDCVILDSKVTEQSQRYVFEVKYQYSWQGKTYVSDQFSGKRTDFPEYDKAQRLVQRYQEDSKASCYVKDRKSTRLNSSH